MGFLKQILRYLNPFGGINTAIDAVRGELGTNLGNIANGFADKAEDYINSQTGGVTERDKAMMEYQTSEREAAQDWTAQREDTRYQRSVADMQAAGINPMMAAGGVGTASSSSSGQSAPGASSAALSLSDLIFMKKQLELMEAQRKNIDADTENKGVEQQKTLADILHINADTARIQDTRRVLQESAQKLQIENYVNDVLKGIRIEQERMNLVLTDEQVNAVHNAAQKASEEIKLIAEHIESEDAKQALMSASETLTRLEVSDKQKYLVYADALYKAQSEEAKANAQDAALRFAYDKNLLTADFAKAIIDKAKAEGAIQKNYAWSEQLVRDLVENPKRPDKYKGQLSSEDWRIMRNGLTTAFFLTPQGLASNKGAITNR